ncbi:hypothetical protein EAG_15804 [Camponotus floridanus]|uniref:Uncharacterized protein n=1 Tax=Camponotus floridanus TaxID=104421 RepID=E2AUF2_CAMFO|nr:uncharacterized protein LOC105256154 [Camponotus floridanus]EFN62911.1 hypothetical protein EAG_15804 [Camponotus floridanus]
MDNNNEATSLSYNDSISAATGIMNCHSENMSAEESLLLRHLQRGISETTEENITFTKEITNLLFKLHLEIKILPNDIKEGLEKLSLILNAEKLFEFDETVLRVIRERKIIEEKRRQQEEKRMSVIHDKLLRNCMKLQTKLNHLQDAVDSLQNTIDTTENEKHNLYCNKIFLSTKMKEYQQAVEKLETDLSDMQVDELYPEKILNKYKLYLEGTSKLADVNQSLAQYGDLPPNLLQAKLLLENKRKEYENLDRLFLEKTQ